MRHLVFLKSVALIMLWSLALASAVALAGCASGPTVQKALTHSQELLDCLDTQADIVEAAEAGEMTVPDARTAFDKIKAECEAIVNAVSQELEGEE